MKFSGLMLTVLLCVVLSGCTQYWYQEGKSFADCQRDFKDCRTEMKQYKDGGQIDMGVYSDRFEKECMEEKGYELVGEGDLPIRVKRQSSMNEGQRYGIAGSVD